MDQVGAKRYCCRRMLMTHVDLIEKLLQYVLSVSLVLAGARCTCGGVHLANRHIDMTLPSGD